MYSIFHIEFIWALAQILHKNGEEQTEIVGLVSDTIDSARAEIEQTEPDFDQPYWGFYGRDTFLPQYTAAGYVQAPPVEGDDSLRYIVNPYFRGNT